MPAKHVLDRHGPFEQKGDLQGKDGHHGHQGVPQPVAAYDSNLTETPPPGRRDVARPHGLDGRRPHEAGCCDGHPRPKGQGRQH